jgi:hypothetical protein
MDWFTGLVIISIIVGLTAPFIHLWIAYVYVPRKFSASLFSPQTARQAVALLRNVMQYREAETSPTVFEELCGALGSHLGAYLGKYLGGMTGRTSHSMDAAVLDIAAANSPLIAGIAKIPGAKKLLNNKLFQEYVLPHILKAVQPQAPAEAPQ